MVLNLEVATKGHRDRQDFVACAVLPIGDFEGGELAFFEPGLCFPLSNGDLIIFFSARITHFNLSFRGMRASLVFHSDRAGKECVDNGAHWSHNRYSGLSVHATCNM
jgi:hypothetical protein